MAWKYRQEEYLCKKCINIVKRLRPNLSLFFDILNIQEWIIQNEFEWVLIRTRWRKFRSFNLDYEREEMLQHGKKDVIGTRWSSQLKDPMLLGRRFTTHDVFFLRVCRDLSNVFPSFLSWALYIIDLGPN